MTDGMRVFSQIGQGDLLGADQLLPLVYDEPRKLATNNNQTRIAGMGSSGDGLGPGGMRSPGGLGKRPALGLPGVFFTATAKAMRRCLVETPGRMTKDSSRELRRCDCA
jgi:hypothetical protein